MDSPDTLQALLALLDDDRVSMRDVARHLWVNADRLGDTQPVRVRFGAGGVMVLALGPGDDASTTVIATSRLATPEDVLSLGFSPFQSDPSRGTGGGEVAVCVPGMYGFLAAKTFARPPRPEVNELARWGLEVSAAETMPPGTKIARLWMPRILPVGERKALAARLREVAGMPSAGQRVAAGDRA